MTHRQRVTDGRNYHGEEGLEGTFAPPGLCSLIVKHYPVNPIIALLDPY